MKENKVCPVCGNHNEKVSTVCKKCGCLLEYQDKRKDYRPIITLCGVLIFIAAIVISGYLFLENQYSKAKEYYRDGDYAAAVDIFTKISFYKDSKTILESDDMATEMEYRDAVKLYKKQEYLSAYEWFVDNMNYEESEDYALRCVKEYLSKQIWASISEELIFEYTDTIFKVRPLYSFAGTYTDTYKIIKYEVGKDSVNNKPAINVIFELNDGTEGQTFLINLEYDGFEDVNNGYFEGYSSEKQLPKNRRLW